MPLFVIMWHKTISSQQRLHRTQHHNAHTGETSQLHLQPLSRLPNPDANHCFGRQLKIVPGHFNSDPSTSYSTDEAAVDPLVAEDEPLPSTDKFVADTGGITSPGSSFDESNII